LQDYGRKCIKHLYAWHTRKNNKEYEGTGQRRKRNKRSLFSVLEGQEQRVLLQTQTDRRKPTKDVSFKRAFSCSFRV
jgi:hypothetical protein